MLKEIIIAIESFFQAHKFIGKNKLWRWILIPGFLYTLMFLAGIYFFWITSNNIIEYLFSEFGIKTWLDSFGDGVVRLFVIVANIILYFILLFTYFSIFKYIFLVLGAPLFAYLSERTESIIRKKEFPFSFAQLGKDIFRAFGIIIRNVFWQLLLMIVLFIFSFIPVVGWISPIIGILVECYYFGFSMLDYSAERNKIPASESIRFIGNHKGLAIGNGLMFFALHLIPIVGWLLAPSYAVIAATLSMIKINHPNELPQ